MGAKSKVATAKRKNAVKSLPEKKSSAENKSPAERLRSSPTPRNDSAGGESTASVSTDGTALLRAIIDDPDDDKPRLAYADYLSTSADPRGDFIQLQCLLKLRLWGPQGQLGKDANDIPLPPNGHELLQRQRELYKKHAKKWIEPVRPYLKSWSWRRGFLDRVEAGPKFLAGAAIVLASHPILLELQNLKSGDIEGLVTAQLDDLRYLELVDQPVSSKNISGLLGTNLSKLLLLEVINSRIDDDSVTALATKSHLRSLRRLRLTGAPVGDAGAIALAASSVMTNLEDLQINNTAISAAGVEALAASRLPLKRVMLGSYVATAAGAAAVATLAKRCDVIVTID